MPSIDTGLPPILRGRVVLLRPMTPADVPALQAFLEEPAVRRWWGPTVRAAELLEGGVVPFVIEVDGNVAGAIQYAEEPDPQYRHAGLDVFLGTAFQGRGIGTDAVRTLATYLVETLNHHRLTIDPAADNERAIRTYEKVGFRRVGVMRRYEQGPDGTFHHGLLMDLLADELVRDEAAPRRVSPRGSPG